MNTIGKLSQHRAEDFNIPAKGEQKWQWGNLVRTVRRILFTTKADIMNAQPASISAGRGIKIQLESALVGVINVRGVNS